MCVCVCVYLHPAPRAKLLSLWTVTLESFSVSFSTALRRAVYSDWSMGYMPESVTQFQIYSTVNLPLKLWFTQFGTNIRTDLETHLQRPWLLPVWTLAAAPQAVFGGKVCLQSEPPSLLSSLQQCNPPALHTWGQKCQKAKGQRFN